MLEGENCGLSERTGGQPSPVVAVNSIELEATRPTVRYHNTIITDSTIT